MSEAPKRSGERPITITYGDIDRVEPIEPPAKNEVSGSVERIHSEADLEALFAGAFGGGF